MEEKIKVYIKINENKEITDINSNIFLNDLTGWVEIDEGVGDKYSHAQSQYLKKTLYDKGFYNYQYKNGKIVEVDNSQKIAEQNQKDLRIDYINNRLNALSQDFIQAELGAKFDDLADRKAEFISLHNELRELMGKEPRVYEG